MGFWTALFSTSGSGHATKPRAPRAPRTPRQPSASVSCGDEKLRRSSSGIDYRLQRVRRKSIGLVITTDGLLIRAPNWTPLYEIDAAIVERQAWIAKEVHCANQVIQDANLGVHYVEQLL